MKKGEIIEMVLTAVALFFAMGLVIIPLMTGGV